MFVAAFARPISASRIVSTHVTCPVFFAAASAGRTSPSDVRPSRREFSSAPSCTVCAGGHDGKADEGHRAESDRHEEEGDEARTDRHRQRPAVRPSPGDLSDSHSGRAREKRSGTSDTVSAEWQAGRGVGAAAFTGAGSLHLWNTNRSPAAGVPHGRETLVLTVSGKDATRASAHGRVNRAALRLVDPHWHDYVTKPRAGGSLRDSTSRRFSSYSDMRI